ncbi:MAG: response regulator [Candidatus Omnitrophica bacterium]|nr:response regulator [Candidatus Omnitrophota bacterium]
MMERASENRKIMIVDDDVGFLEELSEALRLSGYEILAINDPVIAQERALSEKPDVILLDLKMPGKSGFLLADELRKSQVLAKVPLIAMSAHFKNDDSSLLDIYGFKSFLKKPFDPLEIIKKIEEVLQKKG